MIEKFTGRYGLSKTLRFKLLPVGKTEKNFEDKLLLEQDEKRAEDYQKVKEYIDRYHKQFIDSVLCPFPESSKADEFVKLVVEYADIYLSDTRSDKENQAMENSEALLRTEIARALQSDDRYKILSKKELIRDILPKFLTTDEERETLSRFNDFATYFYGFFENRENMYSPEAKSTGIAYRCINENLPKFLDNCKAFSKIKSLLKQEDIKSLNCDIEELLGIKTEKIFDPEYFVYVLSQTGIDRYNQIIGGYTYGDGSKVKGLNEYINLHNQNVSKSDKSQKAPLLKPLFKQILSDRETVSFLPEEFLSDTELLSAVNCFYKDTVKDCIVQISGILGKLSEYNTGGIFISSGLAITDLSNAVFDSWSTVSDGWRKNYENAHPNQKNSEKYYETEYKEYKKIKSFSIDELQKYGDNSIVDYYAKKATELCNDVIDKYSQCADLFNSEPVDDKKLASDKDSVEKIKNLLDAVKAFEKLVKPLCGCGKESDKDDSFYGEFVPLIEQLYTVDRLYDKVRNYLTKKPYSNEKIKLNFENSSFLSGWATDYETKGGLLISKEGNYYLAIVDKKLTKDEVAYLCQDAEKDPAERIVYDFQKPDNKNTPRLFIRSKGTSFSPSVEKYNLPIEDVLDIYDNGWFKTEYRKVNPVKYRESLIKMIDYFKLCFTRHESYSHYNFCWKNSNEYNDISEFYRDVLASCYQLENEKINFSHLTEYVDEGKVYLFRIYNKDFSQYSKGTPNLHTMYFKALFDERNLSNVVYKLSGGAEMFYRKPSIKSQDKIVHPANEPLKNKNPKNENKTSIFGYDLIKDKRYTQRQFILHLPIELNFKASYKSYLNEEIRLELARKENINIIGIDRGERNLIYISVINESGKIIEQHSLNEIISDNGYKVDYHDLLSRKEDERDKARKSWETIGNIKELKEGYISQVVHKICELVVKYDAIIAMEDLNSGFMNSRAKVEKQVYQKFEKMLTDKLNYLVDKKSDPESVGGLLHAYQLTNKADKSRSGVQDGIIFYVPAWLTSKIDPTTGFASLIKAKYTSVSAAQEYFNKFDDIRYNRESDMFEFDIDYSKFERTSVDYRKKWTICTYKDRIKTFRNHDKNNEWENIPVTLTDEFKHLFDMKKIDYTETNLKKAICSQGDKDFYEELIHLFNLTLQMRNSITGNTDVDYLISPVKNSSGEFYDSRKYEKDPHAYLPVNADANGAYNIARKALWAVRQIKSSDDISKVKVSISNKEWLEFAQKL